MCALCAAESALKRREAILAFAGLAVLFAAAFVIRRSGLPRQDVMIAAGGCHTPATILEPPARISPEGAAVVLHGLGANRRTMTYLGSDFADEGIRTYLLDLPGHGDNRDAFTFQRAEECAAATVTWLARMGQIDPQRTILVGHSMGGAIAIRMADREPVAATIAISPAPMVLPQRMPANLLVFGGGFDLRPMKREAHDLLAAAGGQRRQSADFGEKRAFELQVVPYATHTSLIVDSAVARRAAQWAGDAVLPRAPANALAISANGTARDVASQPGRRTLGASLLGLFGLILLFPAALVLVSRFAGSVGAETSAHGPSCALLIVEQGVCALAGVLILAMAVPLRFLHLYDGDYLASLLLISGILLLLLNRRHVRANLLLNRKALLGAFALGFAAILAFGAWFTWQLGDLWMNLPRWWRFVALLPVCCIFCFAEEVTLGPPAEGRKRWRRFVIFLAMRLELWLVCVLAYYELASGRALLGVLVTGLAIFSVLERLATDALRRRTGSATAGAAFGAILAAWFMAAVFPLT